MRTQTYYNGRFSRMRKVRISPADRGLTLGDGVFDTMRALNGQAVLPHRHYERLVRHAASLGIPVPVTEDKFLRALEKLLKKNKCKKGPWAIRTTVTRGPGARGLTPPEKIKPSVIITVSPAPVRTDVGPAAMITARVTRRNEHSPLSRIKSVSYSDHMLALQEARAQQADDALLLNTKGHPLCSTVGNIFILELGQLITPPLSEGIADGVTRSLLLENSEIPVQESVLTYERILQSDGFFITNSLIGVRAVKSLDNNVLPVNEHYLQILRTLIETAETPSS